MADGYTEYVIFMCFDR